MTYLFFDREEQIKIKGGVPLQQAQVAIARLLEPYQGKFYSCNGWNRFSLQLRSILCLSNKMHGMFGFRSKSSRGCIFRTYSLGILCSDWSCMLFFQVKSEEQDKQIAV